jgi:hypothetical protein
MLIPVTFPLTPITVSVTLWCESNLARNDAVRVMPEGKRRVRCPRAGPHQPCSRAARASCLPALRPACEVLRCNRARCRRSDPRQFGIVFREAWPELSLGDESPSGENRGGTPAGERARQRTGWRKPTFPWRDPHPLVRDMKHCVCRRSASFFCRKRVEKNLLRHCERSEAIQSGREILDCFVAFAPRNDG